MKPTDERGKRTANKLSFKRGMAMADYKGDPYQIVDGDDYYIAKVDSVKGDSYNEEKNLTYAQFIVTACNAFEPMRQALEGMVALIDSLSESIPWGKTFNLNVRLLNEAPIAARVALALATPTEGEKESDQ